MVGDIVHSVRPGTGKGLHNALLKNGDPLDDKQYPQSLAVAGQVQLRRSSTPTSRAWAIRCKAATDPLLSPFSMADN